MSRTVARDIVFSVLCIVVAPPLGAFIALCISAAVSMAHSPGASNLSGFAEMVPTAMALSYFIVWPTALMTAILGCVLLHRVSSRATRLWLSPLNGALCTGIGVALIGTDSIIGIRNGFSPLLLITGALVALACQALTEYWLPARPPAIASPA